MTVYVIGHRSPDTDSICSAIGYAHLKQAEGVNAVAARCGKINAETQYVLNRLGVQPPVFIPDLYPRVQDSMCAPVSGSAKTTLMELAQTMHTEGLSTIPILDDQQTFIGTVAFSDIAGRCLEAMILPDSDLKKNCTCTALSQAADTAVKRDVLICEPDHMLEQVLADSENIQIPVVAEGKLVGILDRNHLPGNQKQQLILVDHNEIGQAVPGTEHAQIIEIIDHHRLGGLETSDPIFIHHEPVGCTATIVANMHWQNSVDIPVDIAGVLLAAILSDTVLFKSPTATSKDRATAEKLAVIAGLDIQEFGLALLKAGASIGHMTAADILNNDLKKFTFGAHPVAVGQLSVLDPEEVFKLKQALLAAMEDMRTKQGLDMVLLMITDILQEATHLLYVGEPVKLLSKAFQCDCSNNPFYLPGVMSRKKQVVPPLTDAAK